MRFSIDAETYLIRRAELAPRIVCVGFASREAGSCILKRDDAVDELVRILRDPDHEIIGANIAYDMACLAAHDDNLLVDIFEAYAAGRIRDVQLQEKTIDIAIGEQHDSYSLGAIAQRRLGKTLDKASYWRTHFSELDGVEPADYPPEATAYLLDDIATPLDIDDSQQEDSRKWAERWGSGLFAKIGEETYAAFVFHLASCWGIRTSETDVRNLAALVEARIARVKARLVRSGLIEGPTRKNGKGLTVPNRYEGKRNTKVAKEYIARRWARLGLKPKRTEKGALSLDKDACILAQSPLLEMYSDYGQAGTLQSRVDDLAKGFELPLQARFDTLKNTNRTSSQKPSPPLEGIQLQNFGQHDGTRECLLPRDGNVFIVADVSSMELHYIAQYCLDMKWGSELARLLNSGIDVHWLLAAISLGMSYEDIRAQEDKYEKDRRRVKPANFGPWGGMREDKFILYSRAQFKVLFTMDEARRIMGAVRKMLPEQAAFFAYISKACRNRRGQGTLCHPSTGVWRTAHYTSLCNWTFQHPSAVGVKRGLAQAQREAYSIKSSPLYSARMVNAVHDEGVFEIREDLAPEAAERLGELLAWGCNTLLPDVPTKAPALVCRRWSKKHKPRRDSRGRLIACEDAK
jgi:hypothetical protein